MDVLADELEERLRSVATPERAEHEKRYLKSELTFLGARVGEIRAAVRDVARRLCLQAIGALAWMSAVRRLRGDEPATP